MPSVLRSIHINSFVDALISTSAFAYIKICINTYTSCIVTFRASIDNLCRTCFGGQLQSASLEYLLFVRLKEHQSDLLGISLHFLYHSIVSHGACRRKKPAGRKMKLLLVGCPFTSMIQSFGMIPAASAGRPASTDLMQNSFFDFSSFKTNPYPLALCHLWRCTIRALGRDSINGAVELCSGRVFCNSASYINVSPIGIGKSRHWRQITRRRGCGWCTFCSTC